MMISGGMHWPVAIPQLINVICCFWPEVLHWIIFFPFWAMTLEEQGCSGTPISSMLYIASGWLSKSKSTNMLLSWSKEVFKFSALIASILILSVASPAHRLSEELLFKNYCHQPCVMAVLHNFTSFFASHAHHSTILKTSLQVLPYARIEASIKWLVTSLFP